MRRSICYCNPRIALAGKTYTWRFIYSPSSNLAKGAQLKFDLMSRGRDLDWEYPNTSLRRKKNVIWLEIDGEKPIAGLQVEQEGKPTSQFIFEIPKEVEAGQEVAVCLGNLEDNHEEGNRAQTYVQRRRSFFLHIDPKGKGDFKETEQFSLDVRGNTLANIRIIAPSMVSKNQRFDIVVRFEDAFNNLTGHAPEGTLIELSYEQLRDNINWKLFVPETGFITLPNLYFNEDGIYRIQMKNMNTGEIFYSAPICCETDSPNELYWGRFRGELELFDCRENAESALRYNRDDLSFNFYSTSPFESEEETPSEIWKHISAQVSEFNEDERFSVFLGQQWNGESGTEGLRHLVFCKDNKTILRKKDSKSNDLKKIYKGHSTKELFGIPAFSMAKGNHFDFKNHNPEYEPVVEIYNAWGSSECTTKEGNPRPIYSKSKKGFVEDEKGSIRKALNTNARFGFVAGGFDDRGIFSELYDTDQKQYTPGITGILAANHSRDGLLQALQKRSCFATTGAQMLINFKIAQRPMGSELSTQEKPGLVYNRHVEGYAVGIEEIEEVLLIRNGEILKKFTPKEKTFRFTFDDSEELQKVCLKVDNAHFTYYYLRAIQADGHIAWSSPIWIDLEEPPAKRGRKKAAS